MPKVLKKKKIYYRDEVSSSIDVDLDFSYSHISHKDRHDIIKFLEKKYNRGKNIHVGLVGVRTQYSLKSALRDIGRTYDIPAKETFAVTKVIDENISLEDNIKRYPEFRNYFENYTEAVKIASQIVGTTSNFGVHAGGVIISGEDYPLNHFVPMQRSHSGTPSTLYDKDELQEACGFIKYDILQVTALSQVQYVKEIIGDKNYYSDYEEASEVFSLCKQGAHKNIFQFESPLGKKCFLELGIRSIYDLANASGMIRQMGTEGGREMFRKYKENSNATESQWSARLKNEISSKIYDDIFTILKPTYGILVYQEHLSEIIAVLSKGKFSFGDGNIVRKKLGKFVGKYGLVDSIQGKKDVLKQWHVEIMEILDKYLIPFLGDYDIDMARDFIDFKLDSKGHLPIPKEGIINWFVIGSTYLFSVIHSVEYSFISYNQMHQKYYYPAEFWLSALHCGSKDDVANYYMAAKNESNIKFLPPNINKSQISFSIEKEKVLRFGLGYIMGLDQAAIDIVNERKRGGDFLNIDDFLVRTKSIRSITKKIIENLISACAFDESVEEAYASYIAFIKGKSSWDFSDKEKKKREHEVLNILITNDPIKNLGSILEGTVSIDSIDDGSSELCAFSINWIKNKKTKNGKNYRLLNVTCLNGNSSTNLFLWDTTITLSEGEIKTSYIDKKGDFLTWNFWKKT